jgi:hypothetical protein
LILALEALWVSRSWGWLLSSKPITERLQADFTPAFFHVLWILEQIWT